MEKGNRYTAEITGCTTEGAGIARIDGIVVFVPNTLEGETCEIEVLKVKKSFAYARLVSVLKASEERIKSGCEYFPKCGGCSLWHMTYREELRIKETRVRDAIERIGGLSVPINTIIGAEAITCYRNKAQFPAGDGISGFYRSRSHDIVPSDRCLIQSEESDRLRHAVESWQKRFKIPHYDERRRRGLLRHIYVRNGRYKTLLTIVATGKIPHTDELIEEARKACANLGGVVLNINREDTNVILGEKYITLWGDGYSEDEMCNLRFRISPAAFYQVNHAQTEKLYAKATELALSNGAETALDLYCGIGTITLCLAKKLKKVIGVEVIPEAVADAKKNAEINGISNAEFICADAGEAAQKICGHGEKPDVIIVDPPRKGISPEVTDAMVKMEPKSIVYVSCDPATLARDLKELSEKGYTPVSATPVDMFPRTKHVETVVSLVRRNEKRTGQ